MISKEVSESVLERCPYANEEIVKEKVSMLPEAVDIDLLLLEGFCLLSPKELLSLCQICHFSLPASPLFASHVPVFVAR